MWWCVSVAAPHDIEFYTGHTHLLCHWLPHTITGPRMLTLTYTHAHKTFHGIIAFNRSRPKWDCGPVAGLMSMLSPAEGAAVEQTAALLLLYSQFQSLVLCLSVGLSQQGLVKLMSGLQASVLPITLLYLVQNYSKQSSSASVTVWKCCENLWNEARRSQSFAPSLHSNTQEVKQNIKQHVKPWLKFITEREMGTESMAIKWFLIFSA